jgi:transposase
VSCSSASARCSPPHCARISQFGIIAPQGIQRVEKLAAQLHDPSVPPLARDALNLLVEQLASTWKQIDTIEMQLVAIHRTEAVSRRLASIPGVGPITAMAIASTVSDPTMFRSAREFAAWLGLTPKSHSSGGKDRLGRISKRGDRYIRHLLYVGAGNVIRFAKARAAAGENWIRGLQQRRPPKDRGRWPNVGFLNVSARTGQCAVGLNFA